MNKFYIYAHYRNDTNAVFYIGKGCGYRAYQKKSRSQHWRNIVKKHGYTVKIWAENLTEETAFRCEIEWIALYGRKNNNTGNLVNASSGGEGNAGMIHSDETRKKLGDVQRGVAKPPRTIEHIENIRKSRLGTKRSPETCAKLSKSKLGKPNNTTPGKSGHKYIVMDKHKFQVRIPLGKKVKPKMSRSFTDLADALVERARLLEALQIHINF